MHLRDFLQLAVFVFLLVGLTPLLGRYMHRVFVGERTGVFRILGPVERWVYRFAGVDPDKEMRWTGYALALMIFNGVGIVALVAIQMTQRWLPLNPQGFDNIPF